MPVNPGDLIQISWRGKSFGQNVLMVRNYRVSGTGAASQPTGQTLAQIIDTVEAAGTWGGTAQYLACLSNQYSLSEIRAQVVRPDRSAFVARSYVDVFGNAGASPLSNTTAAITMRTANAGRNQVSTVKIGPIPAAFVASGELTPAARVQLNSMRDWLAFSITADVTGIVLAPIIWHAPGLTFDAIIGGTLQPQARVMVRRTVGRGE